MILQGKGTGPAALSSRQLLDKVYPNVLPKSRFKYLIPLNNTVRRGFRKVNFHRTVWLMPR